jgi:hypothetical protein
MIVRAFALFAALAVPFAALAQDLSVKVRGEKVYEHSELGSEMLHSPQPSSAAGPHPTSHRDGYGP